MATSNTRHFIRKLGDKHVGTAKTCVLFLASYHHQPESSKLAAAQQCALELEVPFAVVVSVPQKTALASLGKLEATLQSHGIPLIALIDESTTMLRAAIGHLQPAAIFVEPGATELIAAATNFAACAVFEASSPLPLQPHPYKWPGKIMPIETLQSIDTAC